MTFEEIKEIAETWFEWPDERRDLLTYTSALLFARDMYERGQAAERERLQPVIDALQACQSSMNYMSEYDMPIGLPWRMRNALKIAKGEPQ